jgi:hypothetical protein
MREETMTDMTFRPALLVGVLACFATAGTAQDN